MTPNHVSTTALLITGCVIWRVKTRTKSMAMVTSAFVVDSVHPTGGKNRPPPVEDPCFLCDTRRTSATQEPL